MGCCYECDQDAYADGCAAGKGITLEALLLAIDTRPEKCISEAAGIETVKDIIEKMQGGGSE